MQLDSLERRSSTTSSSRLPVNPRRHKVAPEQRKRVATACNNCNVRRIKCSGDSPCNQCSSSSRDCIYPTAVEKVSISKTELEELRKKAEVYEKALQDALPDSSQRRELLQHHAASPDSSPSPGGFASGRQLSVASSIKTEPTTEDGMSPAPPAGHPLRDPNGSVRFLGETSGALFLDQLKDLFAMVVPPVPSSPPQTSSSRDGRGFMSTLGRIQSNDSQPLDEPDVDPLWLPSPNTVGAMLSELRQMIQDGNGDWPSGGIYWWGELGSIPSPAAASPSHQQELSKFRHLAFYHTALAIASQSSAVTQHAPLTSPTPSEAFFARANLLVGNPLDTARCSIGDVALLALMGFYLIEVDRRDAASMYVSAAAHISVTLGAHKGWVDEKGKRVFWTVYILDRWLSCLTGRPPTLSDDAIRLPLPADAPSMPPAAGLRAHVELSRISGQIVSETYTNSSGDASSAPERALWALQQWQSALPPRLRLSPEGLGSDSASCLLHMRCNQLIIVATRSSLLVDIRRFLTSRFTSHQPSLSGAGSQAPVAHIKTCIAAARRNIRLARHLSGLNRNRKSMHAGQHFVFNAALCLVLQEMLRDQDAASAQELASRNRDIDFAIDRLDHDGSVYADTLRDIRVLVGRLSGATSSTPVDPLLGANIGQSPMQGDDSMIYDEMSPWTDEDWPMYNIYMEE